MGLFNKNRNNQPTTSAADIFAKRNEQPSEKVGDGVEDRILGYNTIKGAETLKQQPPDAPPVDRIEELRRIRAGQASPLDAIAKADAEAKHAASDAIDARKNLLDSGRIKKDQIDQLSDKEIAAIQEQGLTNLDAVVSSIKNKQFLTEVGEELSEGVSKKKQADKPPDSNFSEDEVLSYTAGIRNVGFITEAQADTKQMSAAQKLEQDLDELESAEKAITSFTNTGFRNQSAESQANISEGLDDEET